MNLVDEQTATEERVLMMLGTHVRSMAGQGRAYQRAEIAALYIISRAYVIDNKLDGDDLAVLDERAKQIARGWDDERQAGKR
jgi:hypothetical protein